MRIVHIGHGRMQIPPNGHGAVEAIISDYQFCCEKFGHEFLVVNDRRASWSMCVTDEFKADTAHLHDESKLDCFSELNAPIKIVTTHDPIFFEKPNAFKGRFQKGDFLIGCLCERQREGFRSWGIPEDRMIDTPNGARKDLIRFSETPKHSGRIVCLGEIGRRKRQNCLLPIRCVDLVGPVSPYDSISLGGLSFDHWTKQQVYEQLTDYAALILVSKSEAAPLVVMEALMAGLDVVVSEAASANLDRTQPFVHVLDEKTITNPTLLEIALMKILARTKDRAAVRAHAEMNHDWESLVKRYLSSLWPIYRASCPRTRRSLPCIRTVAG